MIVSNNDDSRSMFQSTQTLIMKAVSAANTRSLLPKRSLQGSIMRTWIWSIVSEWRKYTNYFLVWSTLSDDSVCLGGESHIIEMETYLSDIFCSTPHSQACYYVVLWRGLVLIKCQIRPCDVYNKILVLIEELPMLTHNMGRWLADGMKLWDRNSNHDE